jgi:hypothetical protein
MKFYHIYNKYVTMVELKKPQIKWTKEKTEHLIKNYPYGDKKKLCFELGCTYKALKSKARLLGLKSLKDKNHYKLKKLTEDNLFNYYWWGYILADGHINDRGQLSIGIKQQDSDHLKIISDYLGVNLKCRHIKTDFSDGIFCNFTCQDVKYGEVLKEKLGITKNKTYTSIKYDWIDTKEKFLGVFVGFYDGDGCMSFYKNGNPSTIKIENHYNWIEFLKFCSNKLYEYFNIESVTYITTRGSSAIRIFGIKNINQLYLECKKHNLPILERKWKI